MINYLGRLALLSAGDAGGGGDEADERMRFHSPSGSTSHLFHLSQRTGGTTGGTGSGYTHNTHRFTDDNLNRKKFKK